MGKARDAMAFVLRERLEDPYGKDVASLDDASP